MYWKRFNGFFPAIQVSVCIMDLMENNKVNMIISMIQKGVNRCQEKVSTTARNNTSIPQPANLLAENLN